MKHFQRLLGLLVIIVNSVYGIEYVKKGIDKAKNVIITPTSVASKTSDKFPFNVINNSNKEITITMDKYGNPIVYQAYDLDSKVTLEYRAVISKSGQKDFKFPQEFLVEIPKKVFLLQHPSKRIDQIAILGTHNCFANPVEGFSYYQQQDSMHKQFEHGVRMFRPAWHNPSGSFVDKPNQEPILCHAPDGNKCKTVSLATRNFRKHKLVHSFNELMTGLLKNNPGQFLIVGINNYLDEQKTDAEIEKIPGLKEMVITIDDLQNLNNQALWKGAWPTVEWMQQHDKRILFLNDKGKGTTKYSINYKEYVRMNQYGETDLDKAAGFRGSSSKLDTALVELSWFQNVSLPLHDIDGLTLAVALYSAIHGMIPSLLSKAFLFPSKLFKRLKKDETEFFGLSGLYDVVRMAKSKAGFLLSLGIPSSLLKQIKELEKPIEHTIKDIVDYVPKAQDNSLPTLKALVEKCKSSGVILPHQIPNIILLDFATTSGDGLAFVNLINMAFDKELGLQFKDVAGFSFQGNEVRL